MSLHPARHWLSLLLGAAVLTAVVAAVAHLSDEREFIRLVEQAEPAWLLLALLLQAGTDCDGSPRAHQVRMQETSGFTIRRLSIPHHASRETVIQSCSTTPSNDHPVPSDGYIFPPR